MLHAVLDPGGSGIVSRSFSQNVGDVGATYNVGVEGTAASFYATYQASNWAHTAGASSTAQLAARDVAAS